MSISRPRNRRNDRSRKNTWSNPADIKQWNNASDDWHTTHSTVDLREGGKFLSRMEARDGSAGFDFGGTYTRIVPQQLIEYRMSDDREVQVEFSEQGNSVRVKTVFDAETALMGFLCVRTSLSPR